MSETRFLIALVLLAAFSSVTMVSALAAGSGPSLIINDNTDRDCRLTDSVVIDKDGNVRVSVADEEACVGSAESIEAPARPALSVSPATVEPGSNVTVTWSSSNADGCTAEGIFPGWAGEKSPSGEEVIEVSSSLDDNDFTLRLVCSNSGGDSEAATATLSVRTVTTAQCGPSREPPPGMQRAQTCRIGNASSTDCTEYAEVFGGFPGTTGIRSLGADRNVYFAMRFSKQSFSSNATARINTEPLQVGTIKSGSKLWSISRCPGDWNVNAITEEMGPGCVVGGFAGSSFAFGGPDFRSSSTRCAIQPGEVYYLNILYTNDAPGTANSQLNWACGAFDDQEECGDQYQVTSPVGWD